MGIVILWIQFVFGECNSSEQWFSSSGDWSRWRWFYSYSSGSLWYCGTQTYIWSYLCCGKLSSLLEVCFILPIIPITQSHNYIFLALIWFYILTLSLIHFYVSVSLISSENIVLATLVHSQLQPKMPVPSLSPLSPLSSLPSPLSSFSIYSTQYFTSFYTAPHSLLSLSLTHSYLFTHFLVFISCVDLLQHWHICWLRGRIPTIVILIFNLNLIWLISLRFILWMVEK
jgi:hypothetical protein